MIAQLLADPVGYWFDIDQGKFRDSTSGRAVAIEGPKTAGLQQGQGNEQGGDFK